MPRPLPCSATKSAASYSRAGASNRNTGSGLQSIEIGWKEVEETVKHENSSTADEVDRVLPPPESQAVPRSQYKAERRPNDRRKRAALPTSPTLAEGRGNNVSITRKVGKPASARPVKAVLGPKRKTAGRFEGLMAIAFIIHIHKTLRCTSTMAAGVTPSHLGYVRLVVI